MKRLQPAVALMADRACPGLDPGLIRRHVGGLAARSALPIARFLQRAWRDAQWSN